MRGNTLDFAVDAVTMLNRPGMAATGLVVRFQPPPGSGGRRHQATLSLWGKSHHQWRDVHFWLASGFAVLIVLHVALYWSRICGTLDRLMGRTRQTPPRRLGYHGIAFVACLANLMVGISWIAGTAIEKLR